MLAVEVANASKRFGIIFSHGRAGEPDGLIAP